MLTIMYELSASEYTLTVGQKGSKSFDVLRLVLRTGEETTDSFE